MKKCIGLLFIISLFILTGCNTNNDNVLYKSEMESNMAKIIIDDKEYSIYLEDNQTAGEFINMLPLQLDMSELNNNEKYVYLDFSLSTDSYSPKHIDAGDVMLFGNNCLVIFYKSFDTTYSYTRIGHINNLPDLGNENISVKISKK